MSAVAWETRHDRQPDARVATARLVLPYDAVRTAADSDAVLTAFLDTTYAAAADLGGWDRAALDCAPGRPGIPRTVP